MKTTTTTATELQQAQDDIHTLITTLAVVVREARARQLERDIDDIDNDQRAQTAMFYRQDAANLCAIALRPVLERHIGPGDENAIVEILREDICLLLGSRDQNSRDE